MSARRKKVLLAMSGGVDSSVAAVLLRQQGYEVVGCFMRLGSPGETLDELVMPAHDDAPACDPKRIKIGHQGCCSVSDAADARQVATELEIPFYVVNFKKEFGRIMDYFADEYAQGRTPNPCVRCNDWLKFGKLHDYAQQIDADFVASGHYARIERDGDSDVALHRGVDSAKDQSYVLFGMPRAQLARTLLPIGGLAKPEVRRIAQAHNLPVFNKPDSQEICFVPDNDYAGFVERRRPELKSQGAGVIQDTDGQPIGTHNGQHRFTIGQRRGVGMALGYPIFVVGKNAAANTITVGSKTDLQSTQCTVAEANWLAAMPPAGQSGGTGRSLPCMVQYRYNSGPAAASVSLLDDAPPSAHSPSGRRGRFAITFAEPQSAVTPGQAAVVYQGERVLGGGWIESVG